MKANVKSNNSVTIPIQDGALTSYLDKYGRFPPVELSIFTLESKLKEEIYVDKFMSYSFQTSILVPVNSFSCEFYYKKIKGKVKPKEGDLMVVRANGRPIFTGIIDQTDFETDGMSGSKPSIQGRDLLSQFEDQDAVSLDSRIIWGNAYTITQVIKALSAETRIDPSKIDKRDCPKKPYLFGTQPGESKLSALQRHCEALDIYFWMSGDGNLIIGKPNMYGINGGKKGVYYMSETQRLSNVLSIRSTRNSTQIPNMILPIWNGQESVQNRVQPSQIMPNASPGPARLLALGHRTPKAVVVSTPEGSAPQDLSEINTLLIAGQNTQKVNRAGASTILQAYGKRAMARANIRDLMVQISVPGHFNDKAEPLEPDQVYRIRYETDDIDDEMFLYEVNYTMSESEGQRSRLFFCRPTALVSDVRAL
jgi:prophage tail gpP-like protein